MLNTLKEFNHVIIGIVLGLIVPLTAMYVILKITTNMDLFYIIKNPFFSPVVDNLKGALFFNLGIFFLFFWLKKDQSAKGVIWATLLYGIFYIWYMFFM
ncbi:MAG: hypothetical protein HYU68_07155 [Bacteroidetes bacterium]|nr:hypothetical protein [Bacteroidota bacterium]